MLSVVCHCPSYCVFCDNRSRHHRPIPPADWKPESRERNFSYIRIAPTEWVVLSIRVPNCNPNVSLTRITELYCSIAPGRTESLAHHCHRITLYYNRSLNQDFFSSTKFVIISTFNFMLVEFLKLFFLDPCKICRMCLKFKIFFYKKILFKILLTFYSVMCVRRYRVLSARFIYKLFFTNTKFEYFSLFKQ